MIYAQEHTTGVTIHILDAQPQGTYQCQTCSDHVIPRQGSTTSWHYAHTTNNQCAAVKAPLSLMGCIAGHKSTDRSHCRAHCICGYPCPLPWSASPLGIVNLNASLDVPASCQGRILSRLGFLSNLSSKTPVYLVDPPLMDILYPPRKRLVLDEDCLRMQMSLAGKREREDHPDRNKERENRAEQIRNFWKRIIECRSEPKYSLFIAVGVYCATLSSHQMSAIHKVTSIQINPPAVFICPERVETSVKDLGPSFPDVHHEDLFCVLFEKVLAHELAHAYMDSFGEGSRDSRYQEDWGEIIEEGLANALALSRMEPAHQGVAHSYIARQPVSYRTCYYWVEMNHEAVFKIARAWGKNSIKDLIHYAFPYGYERYGHYPHIIEEGWAVHVFWEWGQERIYWPDRGETFPWEIIAYHLLEETLRL